MLLLLLLLGPNEIVMGPEKRDAAAGERPTEGRAGTEDDAAEADIEAEALPKEEDDRVPLELGLLPLPSPPLPLPAKPLQAMCRGVSPLALVLLTERPRDSSSCSTASCFSLVARCSMPSPEKESVTVLKSLLCW